MQSYKFIVIGRVQGVYYRANIQKNAAATGFSGYVKNLSDGNVEVCVTCDELRLEEFKEILKKGSPNSVVNELHTQKCDEVFKNGFEIRY
ncbi:acylphosphatase [Sulfurimonas lithotrophica]|uniref:acylphosphatase n=1 Tax=Sulfurimonas lithotrophica TaxID=2590022 RepID=A0A5P8P374_9BACT|nr:acylphosphatase [Sulfurimonas lithotrophica]QFR50047.1 acylphosphatase [Sulfurimonas lithotrophica]